MDARLRRARPSGDPGFNRYFRALTAAGVVTWRNQEYPGAQSPLNCKPRYNAAIPATLTCSCIYAVSSILYILMREYFEWDAFNTPKVLRHGITPDEAMDAMTNGPLLQYPQEAPGEQRELYYGETKAGRMLAIAVTWRGDRIRVITAYDLDASQVKDYLRQRPEWSDRHEQEPETHDR
jgi:uncharacterized DUF497 family protein